MVWDYFDNTICINLADRPDKLAYMKEFAARLKIPIKFYQAQRDPISGEKGCYESHLKVIKSAYQRGLENILVFEDDVLESQHFSEKHILRAIDFMKINQNWDLFMLGYGVNPLLRPTKINRHIVKQKTSGAFCYVASRRGMKKILAQPKYQGLAVDLYYQKFNQYLYYPLQFATSLEHQSDIPKAFGLNIFANKVLPNRVIVTYDLFAKFNYYYDLGLLIAFSIIFLILLTRLSR